MGESKRRRGNAPKKPTAKGMAPTTAECDQLVALFKAGRLAELESGARSLLERYPDSGFAWKALGASLQMQGKDALSSLQKAVQFLPEDADAHNNLGNALKNLGQLDGAVASYRRALEIKPAYAMAHHNLGCALQDLGQLDDAVASCRRALALKPDYADAHLSLGNALQGLGQLDGAIASFRQALEISPDYAEARSKLDFALNDQYRLQLITTFDNRHSTNTPRLVLCAGIPRSGSTWVYNAVRLLLEAKRATTVYGCWIGDYDPSRTADFHVVKIHAGFDQLASRARTIITSHRDLRDIAASAWLRGWVKNEQEALQFVRTAVACHTYWLGFGALDLQYNTIMDAPLSAIKQIAARLDCASDIDFSSVLTKIDALPMAIPGVQQHNPVTLLHTRHRMNGRSSYFNEILPANVVAQIESTFDTWLKTYGFIA